MKPEQQRIAIAEACGWKPGEDDRMKDGTYQWDVRRNGVIFGSKPNTYIDSNEFCGSYTCDQQVPRYTEDLNAMHEAEKMLTTIQRLHFYQNLCDAFDRNPDGSHRYGAVTYWEATHATAAQRAEAFLRTIGKWVDE